MKIIVTDGAGFIGGNFVHYMVNKYPDYKIICLNTLTYAGNMETPAPIAGKLCFSFVKGNITDRELGLEPKTPFDEGIKKTIKWYLENKQWRENIISGEYQNYYEKMYSNR